MRAHAIAAWERLAHCFVYFSHYYILAFLFNSGERPLSLSLSSLAGTMPSPEPRLYLLVSAVMPRYKNDS